MIVRRAALVVSTCLALSLPAWGAPRSGVEPFAPRPLAPEELAAVPRDGSHLLLAGAVFDPTVQEPDFAAVGLSDAVDPAYGIVQLYAGELAAKDELARDGVAFVGYLPDNGFVFRATQEAQDALAKHPAVRWVGAYLAGFKVHPDLWPGGAAGSREVTVRLFPDASLEEVERALVARHPGAARLLVSDLRSRNLRYAAGAGGPVALAAAAAEVSGVAFVEPYHRPILHNNGSLAPVQSNAATVQVGTTCTSCSIFSKGLTGTGQIAAVADSGNDSDMCFFRYDATPGAITDAQSPVPPAIGTLEPAKKLIAYYVQPGSTAYDSTATCPGGSPISFHGTHTSGSVVGDNFANLSTPAAAGIDSGDGMAPNAKLVFQDVGHDTTGCLSGLDDPFAMYEQALAAGARVHSNSYGSSTGGAYTGDDGTADRFLFANEEMAIFFSAGNSGSTANTIGSPGNAKNVITVGALGNDNSTAIAGFSSRGPTDDGRTKPDITAPGSTTISAAGDTNHASNNCSTSSKSGTSMSCPVTAGAAALLRQYFADGYYPTGAAAAADAFEARAPLVKAALLNGTLPLAGSGINNRFGNHTFGWGRVFLDNNLFFTGDLRRLRVWNLPNAAGLETGDSHTFTVDVPAGQELRATLVWSDPEPTPGAAVTLVNNLNLTVNDGTDTYLGNVMTVLESSTGGSADVLNNVEQVRRTAPLAATHTITIDAAAVPGNGLPDTERQGYALVVSFGACASAVGAAPTGLAAADASPMGVDLSWTNAAGSTVTQVYRADGTCAAPAGEFQYVGASAGTTFTDERAQGGYPYAYRLRGADACGEGPLSTCVDIAPTGACDLDPLFAGLQEAIAGTPIGTACRVHLEWAAGTARCPAAGPGLTYNVYRATTPNFTPSGANLIAQLPGATELDDENVVSGTTYFYVVRAEDSTTLGGGPAGGNEEQNFVTLFATPKGPAGAAAGTLTDGAGDGGALATSQAPWRIVSAEAHAGTFSYHPGPEGTTGFHGANACAALTTPPLYLGSGAVLSYWVSYNLEFQWDGVVVEISTDGGVTWANLPPTTPAGYPDTLAQTQGNGCDYPPTQGAFTGPDPNPNDGSLTAWTQYQTNLAAFAGQPNVRIRWRFTSDGALEFRGFYLDDIQITNVHLPNACIPESDGADFFTLTPCRLVDTRLADGPLGGPSLAANSGRTFALTGNCGVPATAKSLALNVTVAGAAAGGNFRLFPADLALPNISTLNFTPALTRANNAIVLLDADGELRVHNASAGEADCIIDVTGYFEEDP